MAKKYKLETSKEYYDQYLELAARVKSLGSLFQNSDAITTKEELLEWDERSHEVISDLEKVVYDAQFRVKDIEG